MSPERNHECQKTYTEGDVPSTITGPDTEALGPRFLRGDVLAGRFEIVRFIARGGMGEVYEARDRVLHNSSIALKTILGKKALEPEARARLKEEVMLAREVTHPNVCPIYDFCESEQPRPTCFLTMKLLHGETLGHRLRCGPPLLRQEAVLITRQLCNALRAAHAANVVHRDLKPGNIMLQGAGSTLKAIITDFGVALAYEPDRTISMNQRVVGTPGYIAPEVMGGGRVTPASDLYALGVVLNEIFTGQKPGNGFVTLSITEAHNKHVPPWCVRLISGCLDENPEVRNREFQRAVDYLRLGDNVDEPDPGKILLTRRRVLTMAAGAAAAAAGGVLWRDWDGIFHPLPQKRFVALMEFPVATDLRVRPLVQGAIEAIEAGLSRAEAFDRDLFVTAAQIPAKSTNADALHSLRDSLGVNLALAAQGTLGKDIFHLSLNVLDSTTGRVLRTRNLSTSQAEIQSNARSALAAAAELLNVHLRANIRDQPSVATASEKAYKSFQTAEELMKQPNDAGLDKAMDSYREALDADSRYAIAYARLALAYCRYYSIHNDPAALELAQRNAEKGLKLNPDLVEGYVALSSFYDHEGNKPEALKQIAKALSIDPTNPNVLYFQAQIYWGMNRWSDAEQIYHRMLEQRPNYWLAYNELGCVLEQQGRYRDAMDVFRTETIVNPRVHWGFGNLGDLYFKFGDLEQARRNYSRSLELSPNEIALAGLGAVSRAAGNYSGALGYYKKAAEVTPSNDVNWLNLGDCYQSVHKEKQSRDAYLRAKKEVESALAVNAADSSAWLRLALYDIKTHRAKDVTTLLAKANPTDSLDLDAQVIEARIYALLGQMQNAASILRRCMEKGLTPIEIAYIPDFQALKKDPVLSKFLIKQ